MPTMTEAASEGHVGPYKVGVQARELCDIEIKFAFFSSRRTRIVIRRDSPDGEPMKEITKPRKAHYATPVDQTVDRTYYLTGEYKESPNGPWLPCKWNSMPDEDGATVVGWEDTPSSTKFNDVYAVIKKTPPARST